MRWLPLLLALALPAAAHEGHDHGTPPPASRVAQALVRASAATPEVEMVAVLEGETLKIYLDRYATNEPIAGAVVEVESAGFQAAAAALAPGAYAASAAALARPGRHALTISVQAGDLSDLLSATLQVAEPAAVPAGAGSSWRLPASPTAVASAGLAALLLAAVAWRLARRRSGSSEGGAA